MKTAVLCEITRCGGHGAV